MSARDEQHAPAPPFTRLTLPTAAAGLVLVIALGWLLVVGRGFLLPVVIALILLYLVAAAENFTRKLIVMGAPIPRFLITPMAVVFICLPLAGMVWVIVDNAQSLGDPKVVKQYQDNFNTVVAKLGLSEDNPVNDMLEQVKIGAVLRQAAASVAAFLGNAGLISVYLFFLLFERHVFTRKLWLIVPEAKARSATLETIDRIERHVGLYLGLKTFVSLLTAVPAYVIIRFWAGLDFAEFWAMLIFVLNFIPNVGSLIATIAPTIWAKLQYPDSWTAVLIVGIGVTTVQLLVANLIEPLLMGRRLNLSPFVVILSLVFWTILWGIPGAFLGVPMTALAVIVMAQFRSTRWVAVALSRSGVVGVEDL